MWSLSRVKLCQILFKNKKRGEASSGFSFTTVKEERPCGVWCVVCGVWCVCVLGSGPGVDSNVIENKGVCVGLARF